MLVKSSAIKTERQYVKKHPITVPHFEVFAKEPSYIAKFLLRCMMWYVIKFFLVGYIEETFANSWTEINHYSLPMCEATSYQRYSKTAATHKIT